MSDSRENIVPALELCRKIPAKEFTASAYIWGSFIGCTPEVLERYPPLVVGEELAPAPTVEEIVKSLATLDGFSGITSLYTQDGDKGRWKAECVVNDNDDSDDPIEYYITYGSTQAEAALKMWFKWRNIEC